MEGHLTDLTNPALIKTKGALLLLAGMLSGSLIFGAQPTLQTALLLVVAIWSFCRFYYFAFYVLERYVDPGYRFFGLLSLSRYLLLKDRRKPRHS